MGKKIKKTEQDHLIDHLNKCVEYAEAALYVHTHKDEILETVKNIYERNKKLLQDFDNDKNVLNEKE